MNLASGSVQSWRVGLLQRSELSWYSSSTVKNSILEKIYTFSIAFLGLTISKKKKPIFMYLFKRKNTFPPLLLELQQPERLKLVAGKKPKGILGIQRNSPRDFSSTSIQSRNPPCTYLLKSTVTQGRQGRPCCQGLALLHKGGGWGWCLWAQL